jgi:hypothetical protein
LQRQFFGRELIRMRENDEIPIAFPKLAFRAAGQRAIDK